MEQEKLRANNESITLGLGWRASPILPIESMAARQHSLLMLLATATQESVPLAPLIYAFAQEHRRRYRSRLVKLARKIHRGDSLETALSKTPEVISDQAAIALRVASETGTTLNAIQKLQDSERPLRDDVREKWNSLIGYFILMVPTLGLLGTGFLFFVVPTFKKMFDEFELRLSPPVLLYLAFANFLRLYVAPWVFPVFLLFLVYRFSSLGVRIRQFSRKYVPTIRVSRWRKEILYLIAISMSTGVSLPNALRGIAKHHSSFWTRRRMRGIVSQIDKGTDPLLCLAHHGVLTMPQVTSLKAIDKIQGQAWILERLAHIRQRREHRRKYTFVALLQPFQILLFALLVLWTCWMCFSPLTDLITHVSNL